MTGPAGRVVRAVRVLAAAAVAGLLTAATPTPAPNAMWLTTDPAGTVHDLTPGGTTSWNVDVATEAEDLDELVGALAFTGPLAGTGAVTVEIVGCGAPWNGDVCASGEHEVLSPTASTALPTGWRNLQGPAAPRPGVTHLQIRVTLDHRDIATADRSATATFTARAAGSGPGDHGADSGAAPPDAGLAATGTRLTAYGGLAVGAVGLGIVLAQLGRRRRRSRHG